MRSILFPALLLLSLPATLAASAVVLSSEALIADPEHDAAWAELFGKLSQEKTRFARFEEHRTFPFRKTPLVLQGELRIAPGRGLSLSYTGEKPQTVIVDSKGVLMRDQRGRERAGPTDGRAGAATNALFSILRFDLASLARQFKIHGLKDGSVWTLGFTPRDPALAELIGDVIVYGERARLNRIDMTKSEKQRIEIVVGETRDDVVFTNDEVKRYFR